MSVRFDNAFDGVVFEHHFLVVAVALRGGPAGDGRAHDHVDLHALALFVAQIE
jgi:hypothetical protein